MTKKIHEEGEQTGSSRDGTFLAQCYFGMDATLQCRWRALATFSGTFDAAATGAIWELPIECDAQQTLHEFLAVGVIGIEADTGRFYLDGLARAAVRERLDGDERIEFGLRHATHYKEVLKAADSLARKEGHSCSHGFALFDLEWDNIREGQAWAAGHSTTDTRAALLCSAYPNVGAYCLGLRLSVQQRIDWLKSAVEAANLCNKPLAESCHLSNLGLTYTESGELERAIESYESAMEIFREIGDREGEKDVAYDLGIVYSTSADMTKAAECFSIALEISRESGDHQGEANALGSLGIAYRNLRQPRKAILYQEQYLALARKIGDSTGEGYALGNLGNAYANLNEAGKAIGYYEQALFISVRLGDRESEGNSNHNLAVELPNVQRHQEAIACSERAIAIYEAIKSPNLSNARIQLEKLRRMSDT